MDYQRKILDELMGQNRNLTPKDGPNQGQRWTDEDVCKNYLVDFCPHELFTNTRSDLGHCDKIHDDAMKHDYQKSDRKGKMGYEEDFANYLAKILVDLDRRIRNGRDRLSRAASKEPSPSPGTEGDSKMAALDKKIQEYLQRAEACGEEGKVDEAQTLTKQVESMKAEKEAMKAQIERQINSEKRMEVCDICGAFLVVGDTQKRTDSHLEGKQHTGYDMIRKAYEEYKHLIGSRPQRRDDLERRSSRGPSDRPRDGDRDRDRDYRDRDRDYRDSRDHRDRDRDRDYRDSRDRDRDYRDRDRDRNGRDRSRRSRSRDRDRSRRSRSRSSSPHRRH